jgi:hypothetical protein
MENTTEDHRLIGTGFVSPTANVRRCFATDMRTLPQLDKPNLEPVHTIDLPAFMRRLSRKADTTTSTPYEGSWRPPPRWDCACSEEGRSHCCSLRRWVREMRDVWLTHVGYDIWEPEFGAQYADL